ncbi:hypothetical protein U1Q18_044752 [Sarracenia purpurea var. burkii]
MQCPSAGPNLGRTGAAEIRACVRSSKRDPVRARLIRKLRQNIRCIQLLLKSQILVGGLILSDFDIPGDEAVELHALGADGFCSHICSYLLQGRLAKRLAKEHAMDTHQISTLRQLTTRLGDLEVERSKQQVKTVFTRTIHQCLQVNVLARRDQIIIYLLIEALSHTIAASLCSERLRQFTDSQHGAAIAMWRICKPSLCTAKGAELLRLPDPYASHAMQLGKVV